MRWDDDTRGRGIADAVAFVDGAGELVDAMRSKDWVAEEPEAHLLPHLEAAAEGLPLELGSKRVLETERSRSSSRGSASRPARAPSGKLCSR